METTTELPGELVPAICLKPGDVVSRSTFDVTQQAEILAPGEICEHWFTGTSVRYWAREIGTDREGWMLYGPGGVVRRITAAL